MKNLNHMKFKREHFRVDYETSQKINLLCECLKISKSKLFLMGVEEIYNQAIQPDGAVKDVKKSIADTLMTIAIYLNSEAKEEDLSGFYEQVKGFLEAIKSDSKLISL